jgi:hypothetical protein
MLDKKTAREVAQNYANEVRKFVEPHLLDAEHDPSGFVAHIIKTGEVIYSN